MSQCGKTNVITSLLRRLTSERIRKRNQQTSKTAAAAPTVVAAATTAPRVSLDSNKAPMLMGI